MAIKAIARAKAVRPAIINVPANVSIFPIPFIMTLKIISITSYLIALLINF